MHITVISIHKRSFGGTKMMCWQNENDGDRHTLTLTPTESEQKQYFNWQSYSFAECVVIENRQKERKETGSLRKEAGTFTCFAFRLLCTIHAIHCLVAFASAYLLFFFLPTITSHSKSFACHFFFSLVVFSLLFYSFQKQ